MIGELVYQSHFNQCKLNVCSHGNVMKKTLDIYKTLDICINL